MRVSASPTHATRSYKNGINGILADEMGLGKTLQTIGFISYLWTNTVRGWRGKGEEKRREEEERRERKRLFEMNG